MKHLLQAVESEMARLIQQDERQVKAMLGMWVSELEPRVLRRAKDGSLIGLVAADHGRVGTFNPTIVVPVEAVR